ncbi:unnamed protein product [Closterium sp. NIES-53]
MTSEELTHLKEEDNRCCGEAKTKAAAAAHGGWGSTASWGAGIWGAPPREDEEEPIEEAIVRAEKEAAEEAVVPYGFPRPIGIPPLGAPPSSDSWASSKHSTPPADRDTILPYSRYPHSPLPAESTPIGPHDPSTTRPSNIQRPPPHHIPRPNLPKRTANTDDLTAPLAAITTVETAQQLTARDLILALGLSISPQPIPQPPPTNTAKLLAFYARSPTIRAPPDLWHKRLDHPSQEVLNNCIRAQVFIPGTLLRPDGIPVPINTTRRTDCTICLEAARNHKPFKLLNLSTNHYETLQKVYSEFLVLTQTVINGEEYTLTFVDAYSRFVWVANVSHRSKALDIFKVRHANAETQSGCTLKLWHTDCAGEFKSDKLATYLQNKGIIHKLSLPYAHP